jgi:shikimate kinase
MPDHVLLVGMMGSGKTTIGRLLARRLGRVFHDSDEEVVARTHMTVADLFATRGEAAFRAEERAAIACAAACSTPAVMAVAGGAVLDPDSRRRIRRAGYVIWLRATPTVLAGRVGEGHGRPLLERDPVATLRRLEARRRPVYQAVADVALDVNALEPLVAAERAHRLVGAWLDVGPPHPAGPSFAGPSFAGPSFAGPSFAGPSFAGVGSGGRAGGGQRSGS